jgi:Ran GTPase-activating protein (RanGAP) involved in mRNA processing and transport
MLAVNTVLKQLDLSGCNMQTDSTKAFAVGIRDNGAISSVNVLFNDIGTEQAQALANILKEHATLKSLCGNKGNETELDMSGKQFKRLGAEGAIMLAPEIADNGALTKLDISGNDIGAEQEGGLQRICVAGGIELAK